MTAHEFAKHLLRGNDLPIVIADDDSGDTHEIAASEILGETQSGQEQPLIIVSRKTRFEPESILETYPAAFDCAN